MDVFTALLIFVLFGWLVYRAFSALGSGKKESDREVAVNGDDSHSNPLGEANHSRGAGDYYSFEVDDSSLSSRKLYEQMLKMIKEDERRLKHFHYVIDECELRDLAKDTYDLIREDGEALIGAHEIESALDEIVLNESSKQSLIYDCARESGLSEGVAYAAGCIALRSIQIDSSRINRRNLSSEVKYLDEEEIEKLVQAGLVEKALKKPTLAEGLTRLRVSELKALSVEKDIDLNGAKRKDEIVKTIYRSGKVDVDDLISINEGVAEVTFSSSDRLLDFAKCVLERVKKIAEEAGKRSSFIERVDVEDIVIRCDDH